MTVRRAGTASRHPAEPPADVGLARETFQVSDWIWRAIAAVILLVAAGLRFWDLSFQPFHNDEGVSSWFVMQLMRKGTWVYNPEVYYGPTPYYLGLLSATVLGLNETSLRMIPGLFGLATVGLALGIRRYIGSVGSLLAASLLAVSPGWLYYSRTFFAEELLVCFTVSLVYCAWRWNETRQSQYLVVGSVAVALMLTTKSTSYVALAVLLISAALVRVYEQVRLPGLPTSGRPMEVPTSARPRNQAADAARKPPRRTPRSRQLEQTLDERFLASIGRGQLTIPLPTLGAVGLFAAIYLTLFSSFFRNPKGILDSFGTLAAWSKAAGSTHLHPLWQYGVWAFQEELPIMILFVLGAFTAVLGGRSRFALFATLWAGGLFAAYSLIGYKEPWLALNFLVPMAIVAGYGVERLWAIWRDRRILVVAIATIAILASGTAAIRLAYFEYDDEAHPYAYVQTSRELKGLLAAVDEAETRLGASAQPAIVIMSGDYWPLPWYWRNEPRAGFYGQVVPTQEAMVILKTDQEKDIAPEFKAAYHRQGEYVLRPGVKLVLYLRRETFGL